MNIIQTTIRLEEELYKKVKHKLVDNNKSFNEYVTELIKKDVETKK